MSRLVRCCLLLVLLPALLAGVLLGERLPLAWAQEDADADQQVIQQILARCEGREASFQGGDRCRSCHEGPRDFQVEDGVTKFLALTEATTWYHQDKHAKAYELIDPNRPENELARHMCEQLGIDPATFSEQQQCLSCHSNWRKDSPRPDRFTAGVQCESCHGPSSLWDGEHTRPVWRKMTPSQKAQCGMTDVRSPEKRAEQCNSCHIGNAAQGKVVTHEMYAAGHPPLPSIEVETFAYQMPEHWKTIMKKGDFLHREAFVRANYGDPALLEASAAAQRSRAVAIGGLVALMNSIELVRQSAEQATANDGVWPELALFDCQACHHDLQAPSWRQRRGYTGRPGRPALHVWPTALLPLVFDLTSPTEEAREEKQAEWQALQVAVDEAMNRQPFGKPADLAAATGEMLAWLRPLQADLQQQSTDGVQTRQVLHRLAERASRQTLDWHSARQIGWAITIVHTELAGYDEPTDSPIATALDKLRQQLSLDLPAGQQESILAALPATLESVGDHDPAAVAETFAEIARLLNAAE